jgi:hypothetical protein
VPYNDYVTICRKAAQIALNQWVINEIRTVHHIAAGSETFDAPNVRALVSMDVGAKNANSAGLGDSVTTGIMG